MNKENDLKLKLRNKLKSKQLQRTNRNSRIELEEKLVNKLKTTKDENERRILENRIKLLQNLDDKEFETSGMYE